MSNKPDPPEITQLPRNPYALGLVARFLADHMPFAELNFGPTIKSLIYQIDEATHLIATREDRIVGYLGWLRTNDELARDWLENDARLRPDREGGAVAVTIFATLDPVDIMRMIRAAKKMAPGASVYWKRYFTDGRPPAPRQVGKRGAGEAAAAAGEPQGGTEGPTSA